MEALSQAAGKKITHQTVSSGDLPSLLAKSSISEMGLMLAQGYQSLAANDVRGVGRSAAPTIIEGIIGHDLTPLIDAVSEVISQEDGL